MEYSWGGWVVFYALTAEGKKAFETQMWRFIEAFGNYDMNNINILLEGFKPQLEEFPR